MPLSPADSTTPDAHSRARQLARLNNSTPYDMLVIGGGASGLGLAVDAATRGLRVALVEAEDFAKGTSSRATKLVHGGVRYLAQGNVALVKEALHERALLLQNAPHLASPLSFVMPAYQWWEAPFYGVGLQMYDALAGRKGLGKTQWLGRSRVLDWLPNARPEGLHAGVRYWDGQFDDARMAIALARTAQRHGADVLNYCRVAGLLHEDGKVVGAEVVEQFSQQRFTVQARCVVNATGAWVDGVRAMDTGAQPTSALVQASRGTHVVVDRAFWPGEHALLIPKTRDGRVLFAVPWLGSVILGTTDGACPLGSTDTEAPEQEVNFILQEAARYLHKAPQRSDVKSRWAGVRPLVQPQGGAQNTKSLNRSHTVIASPTGLVTVTGGKWTTYRAIAEDVMTRCREWGLIPKDAGPCQTAHTPLMGAPTNAGERPQARDLQGVPSAQAYGTEASLLASLPGANTWLSERYGLTEAMVRFAARYESAHTVEDVLARRSRVLFLDAQASLQLAPTVARILQEELTGDPALGAFEALARTYQ